MKPSARRRRYKVFLTAFDKDGQVIERQVMPFEEYYDGEPELIDSETYRFNRSIVRVTGKIYGPSGVLDQKFEVYYDDKGEYLRSKAVHRDGTVAED